MAVYKPTQCYPYLTAVDMKVGSEPVYFTCKVNTSNKNITGYKVILLDGANNIVFSGGSKPSGADEFMEQISPLSELAEITVEPNINTGVNDTYIQIPLVQAFDEMLLLSFNCIYYHSDTETWTDCYNQEVKIKNNGTTYKWKIMLFQGTNGVIVNDTVAPYSSNYENIDASEYDLVIASGTVCGTTSQRLQIPPSDEILIQKWVQLAYQTGAGYEHVGSRGNIKSYDATLGHIYPVSDWMDAKILNSNRATHCCIYKHSNNADDIPTTDIVKYGFTTTVTFNNTTNNIPKGLTFSVGGVSYTVEKGDLILLMGQGTPANPERAKMNGVWVADSTTWGRSGNFKDWASYLGRIIYVGGTVGGDDSNGTVGRNYMSQASYGGTLYTPLMSNLSSSSSLYFTEEQPLTLYPELLEDSVQYRTTSSGVPAADLTTVDGYEVQTGDIILASTGIYQRESSSWTKIKDIDSNKYYYVAQGQIKGCKTYKGWSTVSYDLCYGQLSYNSTGQTYIAQNVNLEPGQRLFFTNAEDGVLLADGTIQNYITINSIDKDMWWIRHETLAEPLSSTDPYTYNIQTYFNTSDETAFYAYDAPSLDLNIESTASVDLVATTVEGSTAYLSSLPAYSTQLIDGQTINNNTSALGIGTVDGQEQIGVYTASLEEIGDGGESTIPTIDYLYSSGSTLQQMPYLVDVMETASCPTSSGIIIDGYTLTVGSYVFGWCTQYGGLGVYEVTELVDAVTYTLSPLVTVNTNRDYIVYIKNGTQYGHRFYRVTTTPSNYTMRTQVSLTFDGVAFDQMPANSTFYGYYPGDYGNEAATRGIRKYRKTPDGSIPYMDLDGSSTSSIGSTAVQQGATYKNKIVRLNGRSISIVNQTETETAFAITWTPADSFDEKSAFYIRNGNQYGGRTVTIGTDANNNRKYIQDGLTSVGIDNIYEVTLTNKEGSFSVPVLYKGTVNTRFISLVGEYVQSQSASWMSYRWLLADQNGQVIQDTGRHFAGEMKVSFYGLMENQTYYAVLIVEDQLGNSLMSCAEIYSRFDPQDLEIDFKAKYDCNIYGVVLSIKDMGYILPYQTDAEVATAYVSPDESLTYRNISRNLMRISGSNGSMFANINGDANKNGVKYKYYFGYGETITPIENKLLTEEDSGTTFRMVTRLDANYRGRIVRFAAQTYKIINGQPVTDPDDPEFELKYLVIDIIAPDDFTSPTNRVLDYDNLNSTTSTLNPDRHQLYANVGYTTADPMDSSASITALCSLVPIYTCWEPLSNNQISNPQIHYYRQFNAAQSYDRDGNWENHFTDEYVNATKIRLGGKLYGPLDMNINSDKPLNPCCLVIDFEDPDNGDSIWEDTFSGVLPESVTVGGITYDTTVQRKEYGVVVYLDSDVDNQCKWKDDINGSTQYWTDEATGVKPFAIVKRHPPVAFTADGSIVQYGFDIRLQGYDGLSNLVASTTGATTVFEEGEDKISIQVERIVGSNTLMNRSVASESE